MKTQSNIGRGFTLIELLVVIAVIALLAAVLFPVFARARENGRRTSCLSNLRQIGTAMKMYEQDFDEHIPAFCLFSTSGAALNSQGVPISWDVAIHPYLKNGQVLMCPSDTDSVPQNIPGLGSRVFRSYAITANVQSRTLADIPAPASAVLLLEAQMFFSKQSEWGMDAVISVLNKQTLKPEYPTVSEKPSFRHNDTGNYLFEDSHVKSLPGPKPAFPGYRTNSDGVAVCDTNDPLPR